MNVIQSLPACPSGSFALALLNALPAMISHWDRDLRCRFSSDSFCKAHDKTAEQMLGLHLSDLWGPLIFARDMPFILHALRGEPQAFECYRPWQDGQSRYVLVAYVPAIIDGVVEGVFAAITDITCVKKSDAELLIANSVFQKTVEAIVVSDDQNRILSINPAFTNITGFTSAEALGQTRALYSAERHDKAYQPADRASIDETHRPWRGDVWMRRKNGERFLASKTVSELYDPVSGQTRFLSVFNDATELVLRNERLRHLALYDALTDLPNRYFLMERLQHLCDLGAREERRTAVLFIDLDRFKQVNDTCGHKAGDIVLIEVASRLRAAVRQTDTVARLGGDEFVVLLSNPASQARVVQVTRRILKALVAPMIVLGEPIEIGTSIGIALGPADGDTPASLLEYADAAMYTAKAAGRGTFRFYGSTGGVVPFANKPEEGIRDNTG